MKTIDLLKDNVRTLFFRYLFPSISATLVTSIYILADTIMIGKGIGGEAVAGLNIILPLFSLMFGIGYLFGNGGAILMSVSLGMGDEKRAREYFSTAFFFAGSISIVLILLTYLLFEPLIRILGVTDATYFYVTQYGKIFITGIPFFVLSPFLQIFVRNDKAAKKSMAAVITGGVLNIILDYIFIFIFNWGMFGASFATVLGSFTTFLILCSHFLSKENSLHFSRKNIILKRLKSIFENGFSSFLVEISSGIVIFAFNHQLLKYTGVTGVTVYSIISNSALIVSSLINGIAQAAQPILSRNYGANLKNRVQSTLRYGLITACLTGFIIMIIGLFFPSMVIYAFLNPSEEIFAMAKPAIQLYSLAFLGMAGNIFLNTYFQSVLQPKLALLLSFMRGLILNLIILYLLPLILNVNGIWLTMPFTEFITLLVALILLKKYIPDNKTNASKQVSIDNEFIS
ncbi:MAG: MATE family efflux transporter [Candidatus Galacturonibacter soehngenii]|nr:MATE family efflux transporter [Candidatus Galacturonibacter soehngenii]